MEVFALWMTLIQPLSSKPQTQRTHWSKIRAKPHIGTLPPLKQIRPWRLIKNMSECNPCFHRQGGTKEGSQLFSATLQKTEQCYSQEAQRASLTCTCIHTQPPYITVKCCFGFILFFVSQKTNSLVGNKLLLQLRDRVRVRSIFRPITAITEQRLLHQTSHSREGRDGVADEEKQSVCLAQGRNRPIRSKTQTHPSIQVRWLLAAIISRFTF